MGANSEYNSNLKVETGGSLVTNQNSAGFKVVLLLGLFTVIFLCPCLNSLGIFSLLLFCGMGEGWQRKKGDYLLPFISSRCSGREGPAATCASTGPCVEKGPGLVDSLPSPC